MTLHFGRCIFAEWKLINYNQNEKSKQKQKVSKEDKFVRFDLYCKNQNGDRFIVEMQNGWQKHFADRAIVYAGRAAGQSVERGDTLYEQVKGVYSLNIVAYNLPEFKGNKNFFWRVYLKDDRNKIFSKKNVLYFVELSKFAA